MLKEFEVKSQGRLEIIEITDRVRTVIAEWGVRSGICVVASSHTTAAVTINENADPDVKSDLLLALARIVDARWPYRHVEGNSPAHAESSLVGCQHRAD